jgi:D-alanine-D-alanine ligase
MDFILNNNEFYFLEVNTVPGMTSVSIVSKMIKGGNVNITELYTELIEEAIDNKNKI